MMKTNSEYTFIFPEVPVKALCLMMQSLNQPTLSVHKFCHADWWLKLFLVVAITFFCLQSI